MTDPWSDFRFLMGAWETDSGAANSGSGTFSLLPDVQNQILIRRNHAEYPASPGRPASVHDDLMIIYNNPAGGYKAHYYDSEGHTIDYEIAVSPDKDTLTFVSAASEVVPRYKLTYIKKGAGQVNIVFAIAPIGHPDSFAVYLQGSVHRKKAESR